MTEADILLQLLPGVPDNGEFRQQLETEGSPFGAFLQDNLVNCWGIPGASTTEAIALALLSRPDRRATKSCILDIVRKFPCIACPEPVPGSARYINVTTLLEAINEYLGQETLQFDVSFPPDGYRRLRAQPRRADPEASKKCWAEDIGAEMVEEERLNYEYPFDKWVGLVNWPEYSMPNTIDVAKKAQARRNTSSSCRPIKRTTPSTAEVAACFELPQRGAAMRFDSLPTEVKIKILRYLLLLPGKVRVTATVKDLGNYECRPESYIDTIPATKYSFGLAVKAPRSLVPKGYTENIYERGYYWNPGDVTTLLASAAANRELWTLCREIFYGENHFEVLDDFLDNRLPDKIPEDSVAGEQLAHRWLELMSGSHNSEEGHTFGKPPLTIIRHLTIDLGGYTDYPCYSQTPWHFNRIINAIVPMPALTKVVIHPRMHLEEEVMVPEYHSMPLSEHWHSISKIPWKSKGLEVFIPEHRGAQTYLQQLIQAPDSDLRKLQLAWYQDWNIAECPSRMISEGLTKANNRRLAALGQ